MNKIRGVQAEREPVEICFRKLLLTLKNDEGLCHQLATLLRTKLDQMGHPLPDI